ncbi:trichothecene biosynthesis [Fusarium beomiforme]|uniref:Trichothecene biosynthesis n=1 Tax=Fusarium beomiforme TaxID=44412 RepID=A0A9P5AN07_9HYPO|nr:trichothecene biosynthesis [Fusarium beomiforme]
MLSKISVLGLAAQAGLAFSIPRPYTCPPISGNKTIDAYQLYPENADFDTRRCLLYTSVLYNSTFVAWDPYREEIVHTFKVPGLSGDSLLHGSAVRVDPLDRLSVVIDAGSAFDTSGKDISGDNFLVKFDLVDKSLLWKANLTEVYGGVYGGAQDTESDDAGNTYVIGSFPSSILKVSADGKQIDPWYLSKPANHSIQGFGGIARKGDMLLVTDNTDGQLYKFDMKDAKGKPVHVPLSGSDSKVVSSALDGLHLPSLYAGTVLLASDDSNGTVVLRSSNGKWASAEKLGTIPNPYLSQGGFTVASVQIAESIYSVTEFFGDAVNGRPGNRTTFPLRDITKEIETLLNA